MFVKAALMSRHLRNNYELVFLAYMEQAAQQGTIVTLSDVSRLRRLAGWAECPMPLNWGGKVDKTETLSAIRAAKACLEAR